MGKEIQDVRRTWPLQGGPTFLVVLYIIQRNLANQEEIWGHSKWMETPSRTPRWSRHTCLEEKSGRAYAYYRCMSVPPFALLSSCHCIWIDHTQCSFKWPKLGEGLLKPSIFFVVLPSSFIFWRTHKGTLGHSKEIENTQHLKAIPVYVCGEEGGRAYLSICCLCNLCHPQ